MTPANTNANAHQNPSLPPPPAPKAQSPKPKAQKTPRQSLQFNPLVPLCDMYIGNNISQPCNHEMKFEEPHTVDKTLLPTISPICILVCSFGRCIYFLSHHRFCRCGCFLSCQRTSGASFSGGNRSSG